MNITKGKTIMLATTQETATMGTFAVAPSFIPPPLRRCRPCLKPYRIKLYRKTTRP